MDALELLHKIAHSASDLELCCNSNSITKALFGLGVVMSADSGVSASSLSRFFEVAGRLARALRSDQEKASALAFEVFNFVTMFAGSCQHGDVRLLAKTLSLDVLDALLSGLSAFLQSLSKSLLAKLEKECFEQVVLVIYVLLQLVNSAMNLSSRSHLVSCLNMLICNDSLTAGIILPGICDALLRFLLNDKETCWSLLAEYISLFFEVLKAAGNSEDLCTKEWQSKATECLKGPVYAVTARYVACKDGWQCRQAIGIQSASLLQHCPKFLAGCQCRLLDVVCTLLYDPDPAVASEVRRQAGGLFWSQNPNTGLLRSRLFECCRRLPRVSRDFITSHQETEFQLFCGCLQLLGAEGLQSFFLCNFHITSLVEALESLEVSLCHVYEFNVKDQNAKDITLDELLHSDSSITLTVPCHQTSKDLLKVGFQLLASSTKLFLLMEVIIKDAFQRTDNMSALYVLNQLLLATCLRHPECTADCTIEAIMQTALEEFSETKDISTLRAVLLLECIRYCSVMLRQGTQPYLLTGLYVALRWASQVETAVSAERAMKAFAWAVQQPTVDSLLQENLDYIVSELLIRLQYFTLYPNIGRVLACLFPRIDGNCAHKAAPLVTELTWVLDQSEEDGPIVPSVLASLAAFCRTLLGCNQSSQEESGRLQHPWYVERVIQILRRTRSWQRATVVRVRLNALDAFQQAVTVLAPFQQTLLPLLHDNWPPLLSQLHENDVNVVGSGYAAIVTAVHVSNDFYSRRFEEQALPIVQKLLVESARVSRNASAVYFQSGKFRLQRQIIKSFSTICERLRLSQDALLSCIAICQLYMQQEQPDVLRHLASQAFETLKTRQP